MLKTNPLLPGALLGLGRCLFDEGKVKEGIIYMEQARHLKPKMVEIYLLLARSYELVDKKKSLKYYLKFKKMAKKQQDFLGHIREVKTKISRLKKKVSL